VTGPSPDSEQTVVDPGDLEPSPTALDSEVHRPPSNSDPADPGPAGMGNGIGPGPGSAARMAGEAGLHESLSDTLPRLAAGTRVGRYELLKVLGEGGMGIVYLARDPELDRKLAIKSLRGEAWQATPKMRERLRREAQALAQLQHPNVIPVHDVGMHDGHLFIAMAFVDGSDLREWTRARAKQPPSAAELELLLGLFEDAGRGLAAAHEVDLIHRDFKPDNVLVDGSGRAMVADFGLARRLAQAPDETGDSPDRPLLARTMTRAGALMGTPAYMAPELFRGGRGDALSDQFAFFVALFEAVYGHRPFAGRDLHSQAASILAGRLRTPDPKDPRARLVPPGLRDAITRGLSPRPGQRFPSMGGAVSAIVEARAQLRGDGPPRRTVRRVSGVLALTSAVALAGTVAMALNGGGGEIGGYLRARVPLGGQSIEALTEGLSGELSNGANAARSGWVALSEGRAAPLLVRLETDGSDGDPDFGAQGAPLRALALIELGEYTRARAILETLDPELWNQPALVVARARVGDDPEAALAALAAVRDDAEAADRPSPWRLDLAEAEQRIARAAQLEDTTAQTKEAKALTTRARTLLERAAQGPAPARAHLLLAQLLLAPTPRPGTGGGAEARTDAHRHLEAARAASPVELDPRYTLAHAEFLLDAGCGQGAQAALAAASEVPAALDPRHWHTLLELDLQRVELAAFWRFDTTLDPTWTTLDPAWTTWVELAQLTPAETAALAGRRAALPEADAEERARALALLRTQRALETQDRDQSPFDPRLRAQSPALALRTAQVLLDHAEHRYEAAYSGLSEALNRARGPRARAEILALRGRLQATDGDPNPALESLLSAWQTLNRARSPSPLALVEVADLCARFLRDGPSDRDGRARQIARRLSEQLPHHGGAWALVADTTGASSGREAKRARQRAETFEWCR